MEHRDITLVTGGTGQLGKAIKQAIFENEHLSSGSKMIYIGSKDYDLTNSNEVREMFLRFKPYRVIHCAARVGGIVENMNYPASYIMENVTMDTNMLNAALKSETPRFTSILSTCIYPDKLSPERYPMKESDLHDGPPTPTNFQYAIAKRNTAVMIDAINKQYGTKYNYIIPCNLFGKYDKFDFNRSHFVAALIRKIYDAIFSLEGEVQLFGDGTPIRQFILAEDLARIIVYMSAFDITESFNVASSEHYTIDEMARIAISKINPSLRIVYDNSKPNGQLNKLVSNDKFKELFPGFEFTPFEKAIEDTYLSYRLSQIK